MFNITQIQTGFKGLVGFKKANDPSYPTILPALLTSISGMFIDHPLCSIENLYNAGPDFGGFAADDAERDSLFNAYLNDLYNDACTNLVAKLLQTKKINDNAKSLLQNQALYTGFGFVGDKIIKHSRFVGFQINTAKKNNIMAILSKIGFQVDEEQTVTFYLYHTSQVEPVQEIEFVIPRANSFAWKDTLNQVLLSYMNGDAISSEGFFIFGYYEDDIQGQVIRMNKNLQNEPCLSCSNADLLAFKAYNEYIGIRAIEVPMEALNEDKTIFDVSQMTYSKNTNFGINLSITTTCDLTSFFISNKLAFTDALAKQLMLNIITKIAYSTRINAISDKTKGLAMADLDVESKSSFINAEYNQAIKALDVDFSGFDKDCLPCKYNSGITYSAV